MKKRIISILISVGLLLSFIPFTATPAAGAASINGLDITSGGTSFPSGVKENDLVSDGYHWDAVLKTLTLRDLTVNGAIKLSVPGDVTLELEGDNVIRYGADGGIYSVDSGMLRLDIKEGEGGGTLALNATTAATSATSNAIYIYQPCTVRIDGARVTVNHNLASNANPCAINIQEIGSSPRGGLEVVNGGYLKVERGGLTLSGRLLVEGTNSTGAASYMSITASRAGWLDAAAVCGMVEVKNKGELYINETASGTSVTALQALSTYAGSNGFALRVDGGILEARGSYYGAWIFGDIYLGNDGSATFYSSTNDALYAMRNLYLDGDYYFSAATGGNFLWWGLGFAFRLVGNEITLDEGSPKIVKGSTSSNINVSMSILYNKQLEPPILTGYSYSRAVWSGLLTQGWVRAGTGNSYPLRRFKIMTALTAHDCTIPGTYQVGTNPALSYDFATEAGVKGGVKPYKYEFFGPEWLQIDPDTGVITSNGAPAAPADPTIAMVRITDSDTAFDRTDNANSITVKVYVGEVSPLPLAVTCPDIPERNVNEAVAPIQAAGTGGTAPYFYSMTGPDWLSIDPKTGVITGTPTQAAPADTATVTVTDCAAPTPASFPVTIQVGAVYGPLTFTNYGWGVPSTYTDTNITAIDVSAGVMGGKPDYFYTMTGKAGTEWLSINYYTGEITGRTPTAAQGAISGGLTITVTDSSNPAKSDSITIDVGAVNVPLVASDLTFFHYDDFDVPRTYPGVALDGTVPLGLNETCSVRPVSINVSSGVSGGTKFTDGKDYLFSIDYTNYGTALGYPTGADYAAPTWLLINPTTGELYSDPSPTNKSVNRKAQKARIWVEDALGEQRFITISIGPVSDLRFNDKTGTGSGTTGYTTGPTTGYGVPPGSPGSLVYVSGNADDDPYPKCMHPHYGMIGGSPTGSGLGSYSFAIIDGPEWLTLGLYGCFSGKYNSSGTSVAYQNGVRPLGPRPATTVTIRFFDALGADEVITLPVGEVYGGSNPQPFTFTYDPTYDIPARLVGTPIPTSPTNVDVSRSVTGVTDVTFSLAMDNDKNWVKIDPITGVIYGTPGPGDVGPATTALITVTSSASSAYFPGQSRDMTLPGTTTVKRITIGAVMSSYLRFEKPATWGGDIPSGEVGSAFTGLDCGCCASGGVEDYVYSMTFPAPAAEAAKWSSWLSINPATGVITASGNKRPTVELPENIATVKVTDATGDYKNISVVVGAVTSTPLVFVWLDTYVIEAGVEFTPILGLDVSDSASGGGGTSNFVFTKDSGPGWLTVNPDGTIEGIRGAQESNPADLVVRVTDNAGNTRTITIQVGEVKPNVPPPPPLIFTGPYTIPTPMKPMVVGQTISLNISGGVSGGVPGTLPNAKYKYSIVGPTWLSIDPNTGVITGKPGASDSARTATVIITDYAAPPTTIIVQIPVAEVKIPQPLTFTKQANHDITAVVDTLVTVGDIDTTTKVIAGVWGGIDPYEFSMTVAGNASGTNAGLWNWLSIDQATGVISGTPTDIQKARPATTATVTVKDSAGATKSIIIDIAAISPAPIDFKLKPGYEIATRDTGDNTLSAVQTDYSTIKGGATPYTYSIVSGPDWLEIVASGTNAGKLTGMPIDVAPDDNVVIGVRDADGQYAEITIPVRAVTGTDLLRFNNSATFDIPGRVIGAAYPRPTEVVSFLQYSKVVGVYGGTPGYTFSISGPGSKSDGGWLDINTTTGEISGTPTAAASAATVTVTVKDSASPQGVKSITINVGIVTEVLKFTKAAAYDIPGGAQDIPIASISVYDGVSGGTEPYRFEIDTYPTGWNPNTLKIDPVTGVISGTPTKITSATTAVIKVTDNAIPTATATITINIGAVSTPLIFINSSDLNVPNGKVGVPFISTVSIFSGTGAINVVSGGTLPYTFSITGGPDWLLIDPATGVLSGIPNAAAAAILSGVTITVIDSSVPRATQTKPITVGAVTAATGPVALGFLDTPAAAIPAGYVGVAIAPLDVSGRAYGGTGTYTYSITGPAWLRIDPATGIITGTPSAANPITTTATVTVKDGAGATKSITVKVGAISASPVALDLTFGKLTGFDIPAGEGGKAIDPVDVKGGVYGGTLPYTYSITGPSWLTINPSTGIITGTPPAGGATQTTATITVRDKDGATVTETIFVGKMDAATPPITPPPAGTISIGTGEEGSDASVNISGYITGGYRPLTYRIVPPGLSWLSINSSTGVLSGKRPAGASQATSVTIEVEDARGNKIQITVPIGAVTAKPVIVNPPKYIFSTKWLSNFWNWIMFIFLFGWIWMWFISPRA